MPDPSVSRFSLSGGRHAESNRFALPWRWQSAAASGGDVAVIDVGSNSVRLVIYRLEGRAIWTVFNEKVLAGLGRGLENTGALPAEGVADALTALRRFRAVVDAARPAAILTAATAAVREAKDGPQFVRRVREEAGFDLRVLSGPEEAHYSALGVLAGRPGADGVVGDLGGSSLELTRLRSGAAHGGVTLPLGPFALGAPRNFEPDRVRRLVDARLDATVDAYRDPHFHAVGGAMRTLALIHMEMAGYPLKIVHGYEMSGGEAVDAARFVAKQSKSSLERIPGISKKRIETLPWSAVVVERLVERLDLKTVILSAYGIREGLIFESMSVDLRRRDPLVEGCQALGALQGMARDLGPALTRWVGSAFGVLDPVFDERDQVLLAAVCRLADIGARLHPDHRAELAFLQVLRAPLAGWSHAERTFLAVAVFARYGGSGDYPEAEPVQRLLSREREERARALGLAMRLGCDLSGRSASLLDESSLVLRDGKLVLTATSAWADMLLGEQTAKRASALAAVLGLEPILGPA